MTNASWLTVYFSRPQCLTVYAAGQEEQPRKCSGAFHCGKCAVPVHNGPGSMTFVIGRR